jgi:CheY-like chemotaxis protein
MAEVLIVDDEPDAREVLVKILERAGHVVRIARDGREAVTQVNLRPPDVVVLDLLMPTMNGADFLATVRAYRRFRSLPIVLLTAMSDHPLMDQARELGVQSILVKSKAIFEDIRQAVEEALRANKV